MKRKGENEIKKIRIYNEQKRINEMKKKRKKNARIDNEQKRNKKNKRNKYEKSIRIHKEKQRKKKKLDENIIYLYSHPRIELTDKNSSIQ